MYMHRDSVAYVNMTHIKENISYIYKKANKPIMAVVKANAYGHGLVAIAKAIESIDCIEMFGVATLEEALELRKFGIKKAILVLGVTKVEDLDLVADQNIHITAYSLKFINQLLSTSINKKVTVHIKIDTGMNRIGIKEYEVVDAVLTKLQKHKNVIVEGVFTHYGAADEENDTYQQQFDSFKNMIKDFNLKYIHAANSAAALYHYEDTTNLVRCGISMYGVEANGQIESSLKQAMSLYSKVSMVKQIQKGEKVGYGFDYEAKSTAYIATIPLGYGDGFIRKNQGRNVYINGKFYPIIGKVCMDQLMIEVDETIKENDVIEIFGEHIPLNQMAKELDTIAYEIICLLSSRIPRIYIE